MSDAVPNPTDNAAAGRDGDAVFAGDMHCLRCGYNLRGMDAGSVCPECGTPAGDWVRADRLTAAPEAWRRRLVFGAQALRLGVVMALPIIYLGLPVAAWGVYHLTNRIPGEKEHWRKFTLWEEATRVPFIIAGPQVAKGNCDRAVNL